MPFTMLAPEKEQVAADLARRITAMTTTRPEELVVLWVGEHLALVKYPGGSYSTAGGRHYVSPWVDAVTIAGQRGGHHGHLEKRVWNCSQTADGRLTPQRVKALVAEWEEQDAGWLDKLAAEKAAKDAEDAAEARRAEWRRKIRQAEFNRNHIGELILSAAAKGNDKILPSLAANYRKAVDAVADAQHQYQESGDAA